MGSQKFVCLACSIYSSTLLQNSNCCNCSSFIFLTNYSMFTVWDSTRFSICLHSYELDSKSTKRLNVNNTPTVSVDSFLLWSFFQIVKNMNLQMMIKMQLGRSGRNFVKLPTSAWRGIKYLSFGKENRKRFCWFQHDFSFHNSFIYLALKGSSKRLKMINYANYMTGKEQVFINIIFTLGPNCIFCIQLAKWMVLTWENPHTPANQEMLMLNRSLIPH